MKRTLLILALVILAGCTPSPRFVKQNSTPTEQRQTFSAGMTSNDYMELGGILQKYLGQPYHGKYYRDSGLDCSGFTQAVFREYLRRDFPRTVADQYREGTDLRRGRLQFGDLVFFETERGTVSHVGIYVDDDRFIHSSTTDGVIITEMADEYWGKRYVGARRVIGSTER
jgi:cell wall-associated NlpC family hydrolase